jgi:hypothetical protein
MCLPRKIGSENEPRDEEQWEWSGPATPFNLHPSLLTMLTIKREFLDGIHHYLELGVKGRSSGAAGLFHSSCPHSLGRF